MSTKNKAAVALAKKRWAGSTEASRSEEMSRIAATISKRKARARALKAWQTKRKKAAEQSAAEK